MHPQKYMLRLLASVSGLCMVGEEDGDEGGAGGAEGAGGEAETEGEEGGGQAGAEGGAEGEGEEGAAAGAEGGEQQPPKPARVPWQTKRIDKLSGEVKAERERAEAAEAAAEETRRRLAAYEALYGKEGKPKEGEEPPVILPGKKPDERVYTASELEQEVNRRASMQSLNEKLDTLYEAGKKAHGAEFEKRVAEAGKAFPDLGRRVDFFKAIAKLPNATDVYNSLTGDLDRMGEVLDMDAVDLGMELARMSQEASTKPKGAPVSRAPAPIEPIEGRSAGTKGGDKMSDHAKDFEERRAARRERQGY